MSIKIYPYKVGSASVRKLKETLDATVIKTENSRYRYRDGHTIINWGNSTRPENLQDVDVVNPPEQVAIAANKLRTLERLDTEGVPHVPYTTDKDTAQAWNSKVFVRQSLTGHSGEGIQVVEPERTNSEVDVFYSEVHDVLEEIREEASDNTQRDVMDNLLNRLELITPEPAEVITLTLPDAPLYTKAINNDGEYRVHVFNGEVILYQKKSRRVDDETGEVITAEGEDADVRNLASNWVYRTGNLRRLERVEQLAIDAIEALDLDFGAVDIIKDTNGDVFVLEINTAPGLGNTETLAVYTEAFNTLE